MNEDIRVHVASYGDRKNLMMRYTDPVTSKLIARSTGTTDKKEANRIAAKWEDKLREGRYLKPSRMTWEEFREQYDRHVLTHKKASTATSYDATFNVFERLVRVKLLTGVTTARVIAFATALHTKRGASRATVARHLRTLRAALSWGVRTGLLAKLPNFEMPKGSNKMGGRPITDEEFHILLATVPQVVGEPATPLWRFLLRGFWTSGLRLREACNLHWCGHVGHVVDFTRKRPMFRICGDLEKGGRDRLLAMAPEFAQLLDTVPPEDRYGPVFELRGRAGRSVSDPNRIGQTITQIGRLAGIVTAHDPKTGEAKKHATAHDLRRAFGFRWSRRVMPAVLRELMRHAKVETTLKYYVGENADATAEEIWGFRSNTSGNTTPKLIVSDLVNP